MKKTKHSAAPIILFSLFAIYLIVLFKITVFRDGGSGVQSVNLIPFNTIFEYLQSVLNGNKIIGISNLLGNLIILMPFGFMTALLFPKMRKTTRILILALAFSLAIEVCQYIFACGAADIDDVILNVIGGMVGYGFYILTTRLFKSKKHAVLISALLIAVTCIGFFSFGNYKFLVPRSDLPPLERTNNFNEPLESRETTAGNTNLNTDSSDKAQSNATETEWYLILVNKWNPVPDGYEVELTKLTNGQSVDKRIYSALQEMFDVARSDGVYPIVASGYRTTAEQQRLMDDKIAAYKAEGYSAEEAVIKTEAWVSIPGTSEHQIGIAVDINADGIHSTGDEVYEWLGKNAHRFGFIRRYPPGKAAITGISYEPWHYRYVGIEAATEIYNQGICFEEYLNEPLPAASSRASGQENAPDGRSLPTLE